jgi:hypothetical protein
MLSGGRKLHKPEKTKFRKNRDKDESLLLKQKKHHDKTMYRLIRQEKDYV